MHGSFLRYRLPVSKTLVKLVLVRDCTKIYFKRLADYGGETVNIVEAFAEHDVCAYRFTGMFSLWARKLYLCAA